jgi:gas vesicle protein
VAIGMLLAPEKGSDLRKDIKDGIGGLGDTINDLINEGKEKVSAITNEFKSDVNQLKNDAQTTVEHGKRIVS